MFGRGNFLASFDRNRGVSEASFRVVFFFLTQRSRRKTARRSQRFQKFSWTLCGFSWCSLCLKCSLDAVDVFFNTKSTEKSRTEVTEIIEYDLFFGFEIKQQFFSRTKSDKKKRQKYFCRFFLSLLILNFYFEKKWMKIYFFLARDVGEQQS